MGVCMCVCVYGCGYYARSDAAPRVRVAVVGKYTQSSDAYFSVAKALRHAATALRRRLEIVWVDAAACEEGEAGGAADALSACDGVLVPGGFGGGCVCMRVYACLCGYIWTYFDVCVRMCVNLHSISLYVCMLRYKRICLTSAGWGSYLFVHFRLKFHRFGV
jgi:hypothetical protein